jgi:hypothetical protein
MRGYCSMSLILGGYLDPRLLQEVGDLVLSKGLQPIRTFDMNHYWSVSLILRDVETRNLPKRHATRTRLS